MNKKQKITNLEQLLGRIGEAAEDEDRISLGKILEVTGRRSFGPVLLLTGIITLAPLVGDIPGVPTIIGTIVFLVSVQLLFRREHFWLPGWVLRRSVGRDKLSKALKWLRRPAQFIDRFLRPRLMILTQGLAIYTIAGVCLLIAVSMPVMEFVPFSANAAGAALTTFGLALIAHDGLLALFAFLFTAVTVSVVAFNLF